MGKLTGVRAGPMTRNLRNGAGLILAALMILSCAGYTLRGDRPRGVYHRVKGGETLLMIARAYQVDLQELAEINNIDNPNRIEADSVIFIPDAQVMLDIATTARPLPPPAPPLPVAAAPSPLPVEKAPAPPPVPKAASKPQIPGREATATPRKRPDAPPGDASVRERPAAAAASERDAALRRPPVRPEKEESGKGEPRADKRETADLPAPKPEKRETVEAPARPAESEGKADQIQFDKKRFIWPVRGKVISRFGIQPNRMYYNGIRIAAPEGTAVQAAADGQVVFSANLKDYGETIILQHESQYATVYANLGTRTVRAETRVKKGDRIAFLGKGEPPEESHLHFEIRQKNKARNPLFFLP